MDTLTITDLETSTVNSLRKVAAEGGHTVEQAAAMMIRSGLARSGSLERWERAAAIRAMTPNDVKQTDSTLMIREDRERDD